MIVQVIIELCGFETRMSGIVMSKDVAAKNFWKNISEERDTHKCFSNSDLEVFKNNWDEVDSGNFWEVSLMVIDKIEDVNYVQNKEQLVEYLQDNPGVARRKGIKIC